MITTNCDGGSRGNPGKAAIGIVIRKDKNIIKLKHDKNMGKGKAIKTGLEKVSGDYVIIQDGDLEYNPEEYKKLLKYIKDYDVIYGSRLMGKIKGFHIPSHFYGNKILSLATTLLYGKTITDMETCYKLIKLNVIKSIQIKSNRFDFEPEVTAKILKSGLKIKEVPISYKGRAFSEGKHITWKDGFAAVFALIKFRFVD